jgi:hypothetical protein
MGKVIEYDKDWNVIWSVDAPSTWLAIRLKMAIHLSAVINMDMFGSKSKGEIVWEINKMIFRDFHYTLYRA